jgi:hypothetical protein
MANGYCPYVLAQLKDVAQCNTPSSKITPAGFFRLLWENRPNARIINGADALRLDDGQGHIRDLTLKYLKRAVPGQSSTSDNCDIDIINAYTEMEIATTQYRKLSLYISDEDMARYCADASATVAVGGAPTAFMREQLDQVMALANGLIGDINRDLLTLQLANFGINVVTGTNAATTVNFPGANAGVDNLYTEGFTKIFQDMSLNEVCGELLIAGHGNFNVFDYQKTIACCSQLGIDVSRITGYRYYPDIYSQTIWGANQIGVFSPDSVGFVGINRFQGFAAGQRGNSQFFTMPLPIDCPECNGDYGTMEFDAQMRYIDCPTVINVGCEGETTVGRGWILSLGKSFGLFNIPDDAYQDEENGDCYTDRLTGNNGTFRYVISNT